MQITDNKVDAIDVPYINTQIGSHGPVPGCPALARVVRAWDGLSPAIRESIAALAEASTDEIFGHG